MLAQSLSTWLDRKGIHFSWVIVAITFLTMLISSAALGLPGVLLQPLSKEFGWSNDQISSAVAVRYVLFGFIGPFANVFSVGLGSGHWYWSDRAGIGRSGCQSLV